jgi:hypothetical protein
MSTERRTPGNGRTVQRLKSEAIAKRDQKITDELEVPGPSEFEEVHGYTIDEDEPPETA